MIPVRAALLSATLAFPVAAAAQGPQPTPRSDVTRYTLSPDKHRDAIRYSRARYRLHFARAAWQLLCLAALIAVGVAPRLRTFAERVSKRRFVQALVFVPLFLLAFQALQLPIDAWGHRLAVVYGQSVQGWASWLWDWTKGQLVALAVLTPLLWMLYGILRRSPRSWWLWFWVGSIPVVVFVVFIAPFVIEPLFFRFEPLAEKAPALVERIERVTARGGLAIPRERMFLMDASRKLKSLNAYVTGFGASKRVVVWDTTLSRMTMPQTLFVFGHEMGHYVLGHVVRTIVFVELVLLVLLFLAGRAIRRVFQAGRPRWGIQGAADWASLPVLLIFLSAFGELASPVVNAYSRAQEHAADVYGLEVIHGIVPEANRAAAEAFQVLGEVNLSDPEPNRFVRFWLYSHPPISERIAFARTYDPWSTGGEPRFIRETPRREVVTP